MLGYVMFFKIKKLKFVNDMKYYIRLEINLGNRNSFSIIYREGTLYNAMSVDADHFICHAYGFI